jgi:hypothetical protein
METTIQQKLNEMYNLIEISPEYSPHIITIDRFQWITQLESELSI